MGGQGQGGREGQGRSQGGTRCRTPEESRGRAKDVEGHRAHQSVEPCAIRPHMVATYRITLLVFAADLESKLKGARNAVEAAHKSKEDAARDIAADAKSRMEAMQDDLLASHGPPNPEIQSVLDALTTQNVTLLHDNDELRELLAESREFANRPASPNPSFHMDRSYSHNFSDADHDPISRSSTAFFSDELAASTSSRRLDLHTRKDSWAPSIGPSSSAIRSTSPQLPTATGFGGTGLRHGRNDSWTPSLTASVASNSSYGGNGSAGMLSPRLDGDEDAFATARRGVYPVGNGSSGRRTRASLGQIASASNGGAGWTRGHGKRSYSVDRPGTVQRAFSVSRHTHAPVPELIRARAHPLGRLSSAGCRLDR